MRELVVLLEQTSVWKSLDGRVYYVGELDDEQLGNVLAFLNRNAEELLRVRRGVDDVGTDDLTFDEVLEWLHERPLYRRLLEEQRRRARRRRELDETMTRIDLEYGDALRQLGEL